MRRVVLFGIVLVLLMGFAGRGPGAAQDSGQGEEYPVITPENASRLQEVARWGDGYPQDMAFSPDGETLYVSTSTGLYSYDAATLAKSPAWQHAGQPTARFDISPDGQLLALWKGNYVLLLDAESGAEIGRLPGNGNSPPYRLGHLRFSPDSKRLAIAFVEGFEIWDVGRQERLFHGRMSNSTVDDIAWSPDGVRLAIADDRELNIWNTEQDVEESRASFSDSAIERVYWLADGNTLLITLNREQVIWWDVVTAQERYRLETEQIWARSALSPDEQWLAIGDYRGTIVVWNMTTKQAEATINAHSSAALMLNWSPNGDRLASLGWDELTLAVWTFPNGSELARRGNYTWGVDLPAWSPDGRQIAYWRSITVGTQTVVTQEVASGTLTNEWTLTTDSIEDLAWSHDGRRVAVTTQEGRIYIWDAVSGDLQHELHGHGYYFTSVAWSPDDRWLASGGEDSVVNIWDTTSGQNVHRFSPTNFDVFDVAWSPDGRWLATATLGDVRVWELEDWQLVYEYARYGPAKPLFAYDLKWSRDNERLFIGSGRDGVLVWEVATDEVLLNIRTGYDFFFRSPLTFSPDGRVMAMSATANYDIFLFDSETGNSLARLPGNGDWPPGLAFSPDGRQLLSAGSDGTLRFWAISQDQQ